MRTISASGFLASLAVLLVSMAPAALAADPSPSPSPAAEPLQVAASLTDRALAATGKSADAGVGEDGGIHFVTVRVVTDLGLDLMITAPRDLELASAPRLCLTGPHWNPLDAGLSDRCWGEPDLTALLDAQLEHVDGRVRLAAGQSIVLHADLRRGDVRCDYPAGAWDLEIHLEPEPGEHVRLDDVVIDVPFEASGEVLPFYSTGDIRFCSYAQAIFLEQGEPLASPTPPPDATPD